MDNATPYDFSGSSCSREATQVRFMYYSPEEIKKLSVVEINDLSTFDEWGVPIRGGLHSLEMGPIKDCKNCSQVCQTCGLDTDCPGHLGHIELANPLYNPFMMDALLKLLRQTCHVCHKFKCREAVTQALVQQLQHLSPGEIPEKSNVEATKRALLSEIAADSGDTIFRVDEISKEGCSTTKEVMSARDIKQTKEAAERLVATLDAARAEKEAAAAKATEKRRAAANAPQVSSSLEEIRQVIRDFITNLPLQCSRCKAQAKWRKEGFEALFITPNKGSKEMLALPQYARDLLKDLWKNEAPALRFLAPAAREMGPDVFFLERLLVPPSRFRPAKPSKENPNSFSLHRHTAHFKGILLANQQVMETVAPAAAAEKKGKGAGKASQKLELHQAVRDLQIAVNSLMDKMKSGRNAKLSEDGVRQLLEKKEGLFRMKMMGKRVNFAARSVISPDPNIEPSEIGVPLHIASNLYYPEVATPFNAEWLRSLVLRGPEYPGAFEVHRPKADGGKVIERLDNRTQEDKESLAKQLLTDLKSGKPPMTVFRQLMDGDPLLVNRQPTLHKPGIMAHTAKVLRKEKTIRLHYVNCNTYNADFDGDEMNLHAPQDPISRMEALAIAKADQQYLVPTSGKPLRGLIQDHVIAGTMLTKRDSFYSKAEVCLLLYAGLRHALEGSTGLGSASFMKLRQKARKKKATGEEEQDRDSSKNFKDRPWLSPNVQMSAQKFKLQLDPPAVLRPKALWSGKQVLSMLLKHLIQVCSEGKEADTSHGINLDGKSKTPGDIWNGTLDGDKEEATVTFRGSDLLQGVLDKASFGAETAGITHMCFELMGGRLVSLWLSGIARLFTLLLQMRGFTCAYEDLVLRPEIDDTRTELVKGARLAAKQVAEQWIHKHGAGGDLPANPTPGALAKASKHLFQQKETVEHFEGMVIGKMKEFWSGMINKCIPIGQRLPVPRNCFASMVQTGAKGSKVNQSQVSCCLGQQELEGRLPPLMSTQRSLPCFAVRDLSNRTRGYIADRFLTGIRPQEFFFHCMAGREGLVDTAVKTSRSGYLQRCLVKHLEALKVSYDHTVRDSDGSVLQFLYGEDGVDVTRATYLFKFDELWSNFHFFAQPVRTKLAQMRQGGQAVDTQCARLYLTARQAVKDGDFPQAIEAVESLIQLENEMDAASLLSLKTSRKKLRKHMKKGTTASCDDIFDPITAVLGPSHYYGATSEKHEKALQKYVKQSVQGGRMSSKEAKLFEKAMHLKFQRTLAEPGEAVGIIAAQSMGEPSTQMTLNTFHLAGHGGANVTLGIPRLREIIQTASRSCSTPLMTVPVLGKGPDGKPAALQQRIAAAQALKRRFRKVTVMDCVARMVVNESVRLIGSKVVWVYQCRIEFMPIEDLCKAVPYVTRDRLKMYVETTVVRELKKQLGKIIIESKDVKVKAARRSKAAATGTGDADAEEPAEKEADEEEDGKQAKKKKRKVLGAEDKAEEEERVAEAEEADDDEESGPSSGMYTSTEDEAEGVEDPDQLELEKDDAKAADGEEEDNEEEEKPEKEEDEDDDDEVKEEGEEVASPKGKRAKKGDTGGTKEAVEEDGEDGGSGGSRKLSKADSKEGSKKKGKIEAGNATKLSDAARALQKQAEQDLAEALKADGMVWRSDLRDNALSIIVTHNHAQCPHSLFVGEVLRGVLSAATLQDPACVGVEAVHVKVEHDKVSLECEGINIFGLQCLPPTLVGHSQIYTNNLRHILEKFGVEAARASVVREVRGVFGHYGIQVDHRHLSLIADYMAQAGDLRPFNRLGMIHCTSPLLQMSYETTMQFLSTACKEDLLDNMVSPASAIVLGQPPAVGTGVVNLLVDLDPPDPPWKKQRRFKFTA